MKFELILIVFFVLALSFSIFYPSSIEMGSGQTVLQISSFLLAIFLGFSISDRHKRIDELRENDSRERANLILLYRLSSIFGNNFKRLIRNQIDKYLQVTLDYEIWDYYKTENEFRQLNKTVLSVKVKNNKQSQIFGNIIPNILMGIENSRNQTISLIDDRLSIFEWSAFLLLSSIIVYSLVLMNASLTTITVLSFPFALLLLLLYRLDRLAWKEEIRIFEPYQRTFEIIGLLRYYPDELIKSGRVRKHIGKTYRIATYPKSYPDMHGKKIKIVKG